MSVPGQSTPVLFAWLEAEATDDGSPVGKIVRLDPRSGLVMTQRIAPTRIFSCLPIHLPNQAPPEILASDGRGSIHRLDLHLRPQGDWKLISNRFTTVHLKLAAWTNLTVDTGPHPVATALEEEYVRGKNAGARPHIVPVRRYHEPRLLVLNPRFEIIASHRLQKVVTSDPSLAAFALNTDDDESPEIVVTRGTQAPMILKFHAD